MKLIPVEDAAATIPAKSSGVYVIADLEGNPLYVGESHTGNLRRTMLRHFQKWKGPTAGPTYGKRGHRVAVVRTRAENAITSQNNLIAELRPRDNTDGKPAWWEIWK